MVELLTADGLKLHVRAWPAAAEPVRGSVLIVHGLGEHSGRYGHVAAQLAADGWAVQAYDQRGHGRSGGPRGGLAAEDSLLDDLGRVISRVRREGAGPLVLLGHSMGGLLAGRYVAAGLAEQPAPWWQPVDALVMSSPALGLGMNLVQKLLLALAAPLTPDLALGNGLKPAWVCTDPMVVRAYIDDPLVHDRITPRLVRFMQAAGQQVLEAAPRWAVPTLLLYAADDRCVAPQGSAAFAATAPSALLRSRRYDGLAHEIFNEPEQGRVFGDLSQWLTELSADSLNPDSPPRRHHERP